MTVAREARSDQYRWEIAPDGKEFHAAANRKYYGQGQQAAVRLAEGMLADFPAIKRVHVYVSYPDNGPVRRFHGWVSRERGLTRPA